MTQSARRIASAVADVPPVAMQAAKLKAANDNHPDRVTRMTAYNGGCSTTSGLVPVSLVRVPTIDEVAA